MEINQPIPNITPAAMEAEKTYEENKEKKQESVTKTTDDDYKKNYLDVKLKENETEKTLKIRLLPMDMDPSSPMYGTPFVRIHTHNVKVPKEVSPSEYKNYICLSKTQGIDAEKYGRKCPFCELRKYAFEEGQKETDPVKRKEWFKLSTSNIPGEAVIMKCIDRAHEDEGVKFWKANLRDDKTDPYHQIMGIYQLRKKEGEDAGIVNNILDIMNGVDLTVTITKGNGAPKITDGSVRRPVSNDPQKLHEWLYDEKRWQDVFPPKPYDYLSLVLDKKVPWKDKATGKWIDKEVYMNGHQQIQHDSQNEISEADAQMMREANGTSLVDSLTIKDDDIPM